MDDILCTVVSISKLLNSKINLCCMTWLYLIWEISVFNNKTFKLVYFKYKVNNKQILKILYVIYPLLLNLKF